MRCLGRALSSLSGSLSLPTLLVLTPTPVSQAPAVHASCGHTCTQPVQKVVEATGGKCRPGATPSPVTPHIQGERSRRAGSLHWLLGWPGLARPVPAQWGQCGWEVKEGKLTNQHREVSTNHRHAHSPIPALHKVRLAPPTHPI